MKQRLPIFTFVLAGLALVTPSFGQVTNPQDTLKEILEFEKAYSKPSGDADDLDYRKGCEHVLKMILDAVKDTRPTVRDNMSLAYVASGFADVVATRSGDAEGLQMVDRLEREIKLPDPKELAEKRVEEEKKSPEYYSVPHSDTLKLQLYTTVGREGNESIGCQLALERAKLLQDEGKKDEATLVLRNYQRDHPAADAETTHIIDRTLYQMALTSSPEIPLKVGKTVGSFSGLDRLKGKVVILDFFAHWCGPCMAAVPNLVSMYGEFHSQGLEIVGVTQFYGYFGQDRDISRDQELSKLQGLMSEKNMAWPVVVGPKSNSAEYGIWEIPETVLIDRKGVVRNIWVGYFPIREEAMKETVERVLKE